jgi:hypothetical protein
MPRSFKLGAMGRRRRNRILESGDRGQGRRSRAVRAPGQSFQPGTSVRPRRARRQGSPRSGKRDTVRLDERLRHRDRCARPKVPRQWQIHRRLGPDEPLVVHPVGRICPRFPQRRRIQRGARHHSDIAGCATQLDHRVSRPHRDPGGAARPARGRRPVMAGTGHGGAARGPRSRARRAAHGYTPR